MMWNVDYRGSLTDARQKIEYFWLRINAYSHTPRCQRVIGISGSLIWSKPLMELIFNLYGEFRLSPEGPVSQIHTPHLHEGAPGMFSDLLRSVSMLQREWGAESNRKLLHLFIPYKTAALVSAFVVEDLSSGKLQPWCPSLHCKTCPWAEHSYYCYYFYYYCYHYYYYHYHYYHHHH